MTRERSGQARRLRIGQLAERAGLNPKTIRYYERVGLLPDPPRTSSGYRSYAEDDLARLSFIRSAKELDFTLSEIREILAVREGGEAPCPYILSIVRAKVADLQNRIERLERLSKELEDLLDGAECLPPEELARKARYCHVIENYRLAGEN